MKHHVRAVRLNAHAEAEREKQYLMHALRSVDPALHLPFMDFTTSFFHTSAQ